MLKKLKINSKYHPTVVKVVSSVIFIVLFFLICAAFELAHRGSVTNQINSLVHNILWFGMK